MRHALKSLLRLLFVTCLVLAGCAPAIAQTSVFNFPDPGITSFRLTTATLNYNGGIQPWFRVGTTLHTGDVVHVTGQLALSGGYVRVLGCGVVSSTTFSGTDAIDDTITCTEDGSTITIMGQTTFTIGAITALHIDVS
jgi:uncharacterized protein with beta-barrel porin domain